MRILFRALFLVDNDISAAASSDSSDDHIVIPVRICPSVPVLCRINLSASQRPTAGAQSAAHAKHNTFALAYPATSAIIRKSLTKSCLYCSAPTIRDMEHFDREDSQSIYKKGNHAAIIALTSMCFVNGNLTGKTET
jgi:hypothetical protein